MPRTPILAATLALAAPLAGCGWFESDDSAADDDRAAAGEVLGGSISDAMIPLDTVQSQSPPLREQAAETGAATAGTEGDPSGEATPADNPDEDAAREPPAGDSAEEG